MLREVAVCEQVVPLADYSPEQVDGSSRMTCSTRRLCPGGEDSLSELFFVFPEFMFLMQ